MLIAPRRWGQLFKICAVAFFAEASGPNAHFNAPVGPGFHTHSILSPAFYIGLLILSVIGLVIAFAFFYLRSRLQFVLFDVVMREETMVGPSWRRYGRVTWRWMGLKFLFFLVALLCLTPILIPFVLQFVHIFRASGDSPDFGTMFASILAFVGAIFLAAIVIGAVYTLIASFGLPSIALEDTSIAATLARVWRLFRAEPGQCLLYLILRFLLSLAGGIACALALAAEVVALLIPLGGISLVLWIALRHGGLVAHIVMIAGCVLAAVILVALTFAGAIAAFGYLATFLQAYALYFLAGRYPLLAEMLDPTPGHPFTPPPLGPGPDEPGSGPAFPMNPAVA
jgi:hypothetical protein